MLFRINEIRPYAAARAAPYEKGTETCSPNLHKLATVMPRARLGTAPRARPPMRRGLKRLIAWEPNIWMGVAARAAPYEKGTETLQTRTTPHHAPAPRARPTMRRGPKPLRAT